MAIKASFSYDAVPELSQRELRRLVVDSLKEALTIWRKDIQGKHFKDSAVSEYNYQKRARGYQIKKAKRTGQTAPLVFSGKSKRSALSSDKMTVNGNQVTLSISVPDYFAYVKKNHPDLAKELTIVTDEEMKFLYENMEKFLKRRVDNHLNR